MCSCDLTPGGCDAECCCDEDCPADTITAWTLANYCKDENKFGATLEFEECLDRYREPLIEDLRGGLNIYEKVYRSLLCTQRQTKREKTANFIDVMFLTESDEEFDDLKD